MDSSGNTESHQLLSPWNQFLSHIQQYDHVTIKSKQGIIDEFGYIILNPHYLIAVTTCVDGLECPRKVYVRNLGAGEKLDRDNIRKTTLGNMLHSVFSNCVSLNSEIQDAIDLTLERSQVELLAADVGEKEARAYLEKNSHMLSTFTITGRTEIDSQHWGYGLSGKFDAITDNIIFELKSSRIPDIHPWPNHNIQMASYLKIMENEGDYRGSIIYINDGEIGVKRPTDFPLTDILVARNYTYLALSGRYIPPVLRGEDIRHCRRCYYQTGCYNLCAGLKTQRDCEVCYHNSLCNKTAWDADYIQYFNKFNSALSFEEMEMIVDQFLYSRAVANEAMKKKLFKRGEIIVTTQKSSQDQLNGTYLTRYNHDSSLNRFRRGDIIRGYATDRKTNEVTLFHSLIIRDISQTQIQIESQNQLPDSLNLVPANIVHNIRTSRKAVFKAINESSKLAELLIKTINDTLPTINNGKELQNPLKQYNSSQLNAITESLNSPDISIIQGPAGTGKTSVIVEIINQLIQLRKSVLCTAYTNMAIDNIASKLKGEDIPFIRLGHLHSMDDEIHAFSSVSQPELFKAIMEKKQTGVVIATTSTISNQYYEELFFDYVLIDEAAQMTEPDSLKPINLGNRAIFVGDHAQLNPIVLSAEAIKLGLEVSLFERLAHTFKSRFHLLDEQYRMNDQILTFPNAMYYSGKLRSANTDIANQHIPSLKGEILNSNPYQVISLMDPQYNGMQRNASEGSIVLHLVREVCESSDIDISDIGIIAPFRAQVVYLRNILPGFYIDTVDRFQGSEREIIIYSTTTLQEIPLLVNPKRINVALTRARKKLIVMLTNVDRVREHSVFKQIADDAQRRNLLTVLVPKDVERYNLDTLIEENRQIISQKYHLNDQVLWKKPNTITNIGEGAGIFFGTLELIIEEITQPSTCPICRSPIKRGVQCVGCEYYYHLDHLVTWITTKSRCPICQHTLTIEN